MKTLPMRRIVLFFGLCFVLGLVLVPVQAQGQNLLTNPGFEKPFVTLDGTPPRQVAQGWSPWNLAGGQSASENVQPEYYPASDVSNGLGVPRIRGGSDAQQYHSFFATHDGGVYQRVTGLVKGTQVLFGAYVYVWSSTFDDVNKSEGDGGVVVMVGIDPTGGTSADSSTVVWSSPSIQYDAYNQYTVTATTSETAVTVFVRTTVSTPVKNNNIYVDDASLVVVGGSQPSTATAIPTQTRIPPSPTKTIAPTSTPTVTSVPIVPTATPVSTNIPLPTFTSIPLPTSAPTNAPISSIAPPTQEAQLPTDTEVVASATPSATASATPAGGTFSGKVVHIVRSGDTVGQLAALYGSTTDAIIGANGLNDSALIRVGQTLVVPVRLAAPATSTPTVTPLVPAPTPAPTTTTYVVRTGDTLFRIATRFNTTASTLAQLNGIANPNIIRVGQPLIIPVGGQVNSPPSGPVATSAPATQPNTYVVRPGDTLFRIALRYGVSLRGLIQANGIIDANRVFVGQVLVIP